MFGDPVRNEKGWMVRPIKDFATVKIGPFGSLLHAEDYIENGIPIVNPSHIINGTVVTDSKLTLTLEKYKSMSAYALQAGDVVLGRRGEIGRCAVVDNGKYLCGTGSMFIRIEQDYLPMMLQRIISSDAMRLVLENMAVGVTMMNLNAGMIANFEIIIPPLPLQNEFAAFVQQADKSKFAVQEQTKITTLLYNNLSGGIEDVLRVGC
jgi:type I restriction enzyme S subunit